MIVERLRPLPHRGPVTAAGAVPLALAVVVIELRMTQWSSGARFLVAAVAAALLLAIGWLAPLEQEVPRAYHSVLLISGLLLLAIALVLLAEVLGAKSSPGPGAIAWTFAATGACAAAAARRANSGACTLIAAVAGGIALEAFVAWVFQPHGVGTFRAVLLAITLAYTAGVVRLRDRRRRHAVQLANAAGLAAVVLGLTLIGVLVVVGAFQVGSGFHRRFGSPFGWELYLLAVGFGLLAYAAADREPGPAYVGTAVLLTFALLTGVAAANGGSLVGWPLFLLIIGGLGIALGLHGQEARGRPGANRVRRDHRARPHQDRPGRPPRRPRRSPSVRSTTSNERARLRR
jgi:hypothetical protein